MANNDVYVWLDCDPGHDDAMAIILAGHTPGVHLLGISTVAGNQTLQLVTQNALDVLDAAGLSQIEVYAGQSKPLIRTSPILCPEIHGESGLDGPTGGPALPRSQRQALPEKAVNAMYRCIKDQHRALGGQKVIRLVCTGALTNAALLLTLYPEVIPWIDITLMGGAMGQGNTGPVVEFNIQTDPESAHVVFNSGVKLTMVPLEVTHTVLANEAVLQRVVQGHSHFRESIKKLLLFFKDTYKTVFNFDDPPLHDPCAVAYVIAPRLFKVSHLRVDIEIKSELSAGQTVCDVWRQSGKACNCTVTTAVDVAAFWDLLLAAIAAADAVSPMNSRKESSDASTSEVVLGGNIATTALCSKAGECGLQIQANATGV